MSILSGHTCGPACWEAREDICRCECGGKNHGCLRDSNGIQPTRRTKIQGDSYSLAGSGHFYDLAKQAETMNKDAGCFYYPIAHGSQRFDKCVARVRRATDSQVQSWPELAAYRTPEWNLLGTYLLWELKPI